MYLKTRGQGGENGIIRFYDIFNDSPWKPGILSSKFHCGDRVWCRNLRLESYPMYEQISLYLYVNVYLFLIVNFALSNPNTVSKLLIYLID